MDLKAIVVHRTFDPVGKVEGQRLEEEDGLQHRPRSGRSTEHLQIPNRGKYDATIHDVIGHDGLQRTMQMSVVSARSGGWR